MREGRTFMFRISPPELLEARIAPAFGANFNLASINGSNGFDLFGAAAGDAAGVSVSDAGDVNGDGFGDVIIGAPSADPNGYNSGASYVVFGTLQSLPNGLNLGALDGNNGFKISGAAANDRIGVKVSGSGDINGDGFDDIVLGSKYVTPNGRGSGAAYVILGKGGGFVPNLNLSSLDGSNGFKLSGGMDDEAGTSVSGAGDVNGDGFDDVLIGAPFVQAPDSFRNGGAYIVFGHSGGFAANIQLSAIPPSAGFVVQGARSDFRAGTTVSDAGDVNGDGIDDFMISAPMASSAPYGAGLPNGITYLVFGTTQGFGGRFDLTTLNGSNGVRINGASDFEQSGRALGAAGDLNGDGFDDFLIATNVDRFGPGEGSSVTYVVFGRGSGFLPTLSLASLNGASGFKVLPISTSEETANTVSSAGDLNGDGFDEIIIASALSSPNGNYSGASYVIYGKAGAFTSTFNLSAIDGTNGFKISGAAADNFAGGFVSTAGDVNNDGLADLILSAPGMSFNGSAAGGGHVVFGQRSGVLPSLRINDVQVTEGSAGISGASFTVSLLGQATGQVSVQYATTDDTAVAPGDFTALPQTTLTFAAGETTKTVVVDIVGDNVFEPDETFFVNLRNAVGATIVDAQGQGTILNDEPSPTLSISDVTITEGNSATTTATFTVSLPGPNSQAVTVQYATANGTAFSSADFAAVPLTTLTFAPGEVTRSVSVEVAGDTLFEPNETFFVNLTNPVNATLADPQGQATILNDEPIPTLSINDASVLEGANGTTATVFTLSLSGPSSQSVTVRYATANGSAVAPGDYTNLPQTTLTFAPGELSKMISVLVQGEAVFEPDETFFVILTSPTGANLADAQAQGTIINDDATPTITIGDITRMEGNLGQSSATLTVNLSNPSSQTVTVRYATADGTAIGPGDYTALPVATLAFNPGEVSKSIAVAVTGDAIFEPDETFLVNLSAATNATITDGQAQVTIINDDATPTIGADDVSVVEGPDDIRTATFTVRLSRQSSESVSVQYATADGTAVAPGDYLALALSTLTFGPLETSKSIDVAVNGDSVFEPNETFLLNLSNPVGATIADAQAQGTILNDEALPALSIDDVSVTEGAAGAATASFTVNLSGPSSEAVSVQYATADGSATAPDDYTALGLSTLSFAPGETSKVIAVAVHDDGTFELDETFFVNLSNAVGATVSDPQGRGTILNDEPLPAIAIGDVMIVEGVNAATTADFIVSLTRPSSQTVSVQYVTADGTARAPGDYEARALNTLTFNPGETSKSIGIEVHGDELFEPNETFFLDLSHASNAVVLDAQGIATILNDEAMPVLTIDDVSIEEGSTGTVAASFTVSLSGASSETVSVQYVTADGTARAPDDYASLASAPLVLMPGETSKTVAVAVNGDDVFEPDEVFFLDLSNPVGAALGDDRGRATIRHDEALPGLSIDDVSLVEMVHGTTNAVFTVHLSRLSSEEISVQYTTADGTATATSDYRALDVTTLLFSPGEASKTITVEVNGDTAAEADENFFVNLSAPTNATIADAQGEATILNDDVAVIISADGKQARFNDVDGDLVVVKTSRGSFVAENFMFTTSGSWQLFDLRLPESDDFRGANLTIVSKTPAEGAGDGFVSLSAIDASGLRLKTVKVDGALGQIDVGEGIAGISAVKTLTVQSLGSRSATQDESTIAGTLGTFKTKGDLTGVLEVTGGGPNGSAIALTKAVIGGNIDGSTGGQRAGLIDAGGGIGSVLVKGSVTGGAALSGILADGPIGAVTIVENLTGSAAQPVTIAVLGTVGATTSSEALALGTLSVGGGVLHAQILAGYGRDLMPTNGVASIGRIDVAGSWNASSAVAGVADLTGDGFGRNDAPIGGTLSALLARIARITIHGLAAGSSASGDFFGITAQQIGRVLAGSIRPPLSAGADDFLLDPLNDDFRVVDFA